MKFQCKSCEDYKKKGHNYCRMCGCHVRKGFVNHCRIAVCYNTNEKYCGSCGGQKHNCSCR